MSPLSYLLCLPFFLSAWLLLRRRDGNAFLDVVLPCVILMPVFWVVRFPHLPQLSPGECALLPLAVALPLRHAGRSRLRRMDVWIAAFLAVVLVSELVKERDLSNGLIYFFRLALSIVGFYAAGRFLVEQPGMRLATVRRFIFLLLCLLPGVAYEYRMGLNPWSAWGARLLGALDETWVVQYRAGHARVSATFANAILAGTIFAIGFVLNLWLMRAAREHPQWMKPYQARLEKYFLPALALLGMLYLTGSRGPLGAAVAGFLIVQIARFRSPRTGLLAALCALGLLGAARSLYLNRYTTDSGLVVTDEQQSSAIYRREMAELYKPVVAAGGLLGWGGVVHPSVAGLRSIDDEYLLIRISHGVLGYICFLLIVYESLLGSILFLLRSPPGGDRLFACRLLGSLAAVWFSLQTVYMGEQVTMFCFLLVGWSQGLRPQQETGTAPVGAARRFRFDRVIAG
jgi:hypothetical protein